MEADEELYKRAEEAVDARLSGRRLEHVHSVAETAPELARIYGADEVEARFAGLLHDWDKLLTDEELPARMDELGIERPPQMELLLPVLHSFTGAKAVEREFPELPPSVISAIWHHTLGGTDMSDLDMVLFIADIIEPRRKVEKRPEIQELRDEVGKVDLGQLYFDTYAATMHSLIARRRFIHPEAFEIWNTLVARYHPLSDADRARQGDADNVL